MKALYKAITHYFIGWTIKYIIIIEQAIERMEHYQNPNDMTFIPA
jgi:hypothetical protein